MPVQMREGTLLDYQLQIWGVPVSWRTRIEAWDPPCGFVDTQLSGPYRRWTHTHSFEATDAGTRIVDRVEYELPLWPVGELAHPVVRWQLERIFAFRSFAVREALLGSDSPEADVTGSR